VMRKKPGLTVKKIAALCCGDTLDANKGRSAFPLNKADLISRPNGQTMFNIARAALLAMAEHVPGYEFAKTNKAKFAHGFGVFQYDLQFFLQNPNYFLNREYEDFGNSLARALGELRNGLKKLGLQGRSSISDLDFCHVAICYNTGGFKPSKGLKQGHSDNGKFYGEQIRDFLALSRTVPVPGLVPTVTIVAGGHAAPTGPTFRVETASGSLRLRREAKVSNPPGANVETNLPDGLVVRAITGGKVNGFIEIEAKVGAKTFRGFASAQFLVPVAAVPPAPSFRVETTSGSLRLRRQPKVSNPPAANVEANLPDGQVVQAISGTVINGFIEVETTVGRHIRGFASAQFLVPVVLAQPGPTPQPNP